MPNPQRVFVVETNKPSAFHIVIAADESEALSLVLTRIGGINSRVIASGNIADSSVVCAWKDDESEKVGVST